MDNQIQIKDQNSLQTPEAFEKNLSIMEKALDDCTSDSERWHLGKKAEVLYKSALAWGLTKIANKFMGVIRRSEFYIAKNNPPHQGKKLKNLSPSHPEVQNKNVLDKIRPIFYSMSVEQFEKILQQKIECDETPSRDSFRTKTVKPSSGDVEWYTPANVIEAVRACMGGIDLDPASNAHSNKIVKATKYFTKEDNGLKQDWRPYDRIWVNPPFDQLLQFATKFMLECRQGFFLGRLDLTTKWSRLVGNGYMFVPDKKVKFYKEHENERSRGPVEPSIIFSMGVDPRSIVREFITEGRCDGQVLRTYSSLNGQKNKDGSWVYGDPRKLSN